MTCAVNACSIFRAVVIMTTSGDALCVLANLPEDALTVSKTLWRCFRTEDIRVAFGAHWTAAQGCVITGNTTNGISTTDTKETARVLTDAIDA